MLNRMCLAAALMGTAVSPAWSQASKPVSAEAAAEAAAAMERAQRLAANPMRVILQAGKIRRKPAEADAAPDAADPANLRRTAAVVTAAGTSATTTAAPAATTAPTVGAAAPAALARATPAQNPPAISTALVLQASQLSAPSASDVAGLDSTAGSLGLPVALPKMAVPQALLAALPAAQPKLVSTVEPEIPLRYLQETGRVNDVMADLSLRTDGTVAGVQLVGPYPRSWQRYIVAALEKWRFEPLASTRVHRIQLVFSE